MKISARLETTTQLRRAHTRIYTSRRRMILQQGVKRSENCTPVAVKGFFMIRLVKILPKFWSGIFTFSPRAKW
jgi:hypothetical protein